MSNLRRLLKRFGSRDKPWKSSPLLLVNSTSEGKLDHSTSIQFRRWASENKLSNHTQRMLALEQFDSMDTIKMLQPDMIDILLLSEDEKTKLLKVVGQLHMKSPRTELDTVSNSSYLSDSSSSISSSNETEDECRPRMTRRLSQSNPELYNVFTISESESGEKGDNIVETSGASPVSFYVASADDSQSIGTTESSVETIHTLREEELRDVLEYMVLEEMITREIQEEVLSKTSYRRKVQLLQNILVEAGDSTRMNLEEILRTNYNASLPTFSGTLGSRLREEARERVQNGLSGRTYKRVSWASHRSSGSSKGKRQHKGNGKSALKPELFVVNVELNRTQGLENPYYEDDDGRMELSRTPVLRYGHKGRADGELQDATSVASMKNGETIVTDLVNNRLQSFDNFGAPVRTIVVPHQFEPWNVVLSPHGWIAVTFRNSKSLCILSQDSTQISSIRVFESPTGLAVDHCGRYIVTDERAHRVTVHSYDHKFQRFTSHDLNNAVEFNQPRYVTVSPHGKIIVSDSGNHCIKVFNSDGHLELQFGSYGHVRGYFRCPYGVCSDSLGNILVADHYNNRVSMFNVHGHFVRNLVTRSHGLIRPKAIHISPDWKLFITHGGMKASELLVFDLAKTGMDGDGITYV